MSVYTLSLQILLVAGVIFGVVGLLSHRPGSSEVAAGTHPGPIKSGHPDQIEHPLPYAVLAIVIGVLAYPLTRALTSLLPLAPEITRQALWWGIGVAGGGCGALAMSWVLPRRHQSPVAGLASCAPGLMITAAILLFGREARLDTLLGVATGWLLTTFGSIQRLTTDDASDEPRRHLAALLANSGFHIALCLALALASIRENNQPAESIGGVAGGWAVAAIGAAIGAVPILALAHTDAARRTRVRFILGLCWVSSTALGVVLGLGTGPGAMRFLMVLAMGVAGGLLLVGQASQTQREEHSALADELPLATLLLAAGVISAHLLGQAFGVAMMLLTAWPFAYWSCQWQNQTAQFYSRKLWPLLAIALTVVAYRLFDVRYLNTLQGTGWNDNYVLVGLLIAAVAPGAVVRYATRNDAPHKITLAGGALVLTGVALISALAIVLFGLRMAPSLAMGCVLACAFAPGMRRPIVALPALWTLLLLAQWLSPLAVLADMSRDNRILILIVTTAGFVAVLELNAFLRKTTLRAAKKHLQYHRG